MEQADAIVHEALLERLADRDLVELARRRAHKDSAIGMDIDQI